MADADRLRRRVRVWLVLFVIGLVLSGVTAFPLETEVRLVVSVLERLGVSADASLMVWMVRVREALIDVNTRYPFMAYGTDWLAFAHLVIAVAFIGPWRDPVRNIWVIDFGMIACVGIIPLALIAGPVRGIPWWWRCIDMSFGVIGLPILWMVRRWIVQLGTMAETSAPSSLAQE